MTQGIHSGFTDDVFSWDVSHCSWFEEGPVDPCYQVTREGSLGFLSCDGPVSGPRVPRCRCVRCDGKYVRPLFPLSVGVPYPCLSSPGNSVQVPLFLLKRTFLPSFPFSGFSHTVQTLSRPFLSSVCRPSNTILVFSPVPLTRPLYPTKRRA